MSDTEAWRLIESGVDQLETCADPRTREAALSLVSSLMSVHGAALDGLLARLDDKARAELCEDPAVFRVLLLHGLHPEDARTRIERALEQVRPALQAHRGDVELLEFEGSRVRLRLLGTCHGCPSSVTTFRNLLETTIEEFAPEIEAIEVDGMEVP